MKILLATNNLYHITSISNFFSTHSAISVETLILTYKQEEIMQYLKDFNIDLLITTPSFINESIINILPIIVITNTNDSSCFTQFSNIYVVENLDEFEKTLSQIQNYIIDTLSPNNIKKKVTNILLSLGFNFKHSGTRYLSDLILHIKFSHQFFNEYSNIKEEYLFLAKKYHKTADNVRILISNAIRYMYAESDFSKIQSFFSLSYDY